MNIIGVVLAAGKGTRMKSDLPKVMHKIGEKPMVHHVADTLTDMDVFQTYIVVGYQADIVKGSFSEKENIFFPVQAEQLGTGHAVLQAVNEFKGVNDDDIVIVLAGDCPLISSDTLKKMVAYHRSSFSKATVLTAVLDDAAKYGRIVRDEQDNLLAIVEAKDCSSEQLNIQEINTGVFCFDTKFLKQGLESLDTNNSQGEYYLTDIIDILRAKKEKVAAFCLDDFSEVLGANTPEDLKDIEAIYKKRFVVN